MCSTNSEMTYQSTSARVRFTVYHNEVFVYEKSFQISKKMLQKPFLHAPMYKVFYSVPQKIPPRSQQVPPETCAVKEKATNEIFPPIPARCAYSSPSRSACTYIQRNCSSSG
jgi:hypothetical protein